MRHEIILVNDGSPDNVARVIAGLCEQYPQIVFVNLSRNFGQHSALMAGFARARGDIVISLDDDGQTPANECFKLIDKVTEGYDIVYAEYPQRKQNAFRNLGSRFNAACNHFFFGQPRDLKANSYFACQRFVVESALQYPNPFPFITGLLFQSVSTYCNVPVRHRPRLRGHSGYTLKKLISLWTNGVTAFSIKPLRFANYLGWITAVAGFIFAIVTVVRKIVNPAIEAGWSSTIAVMPNLNPPPDSPAHLEEELLLIRRDACVQVLPYGCITIGQKGEECADYSALLPYVAGFSDDGHGVQNDGVTRQAMYSFWPTGKKEPIAACTAKRRISPRISRISADPAPPATTQKNVMPVPWAGNIRSFAHPDVCTRRR